MTGHTLANDWILRSLLAAGLTLLPGAASAQDAHYWTNQYGTRAELLGGLVVGSAVDLSATYYNPGALAHVSNPTLILTTDAWQFIGITLDTGVGDDFDQTATRLRAAPRIFAVQIPSKESKHKFAVSVLTRHDFDLEVQAGFVTPHERCRGYCVFRRIEKPGPAVGRMGRVHVGVPAVGSCGLGSHRLRSRTLAAETQASDRLGRGHDGDRNVHAKLR